MPASPKSGYDGVTGADGDYGKQGSIPVHGPTTKVPSPAGRSTPVGTGMGGATSK